MARAESSPDAAGAFPLGAQALGPPAVCDGPVHGGERGEGRQGASAMGAAPLDGGPVHGGERGECIQAAADFDTCATRSDRGSPEVRTIDRTPEAHPAAAAATPGHGVRGDAGGGQVRQGATAPHVVLNPVVETLSATNLDTAPQVVLNPVVETLCEPHSSNNAQVVLNPVAETLCEPHLEGGVRRLGLGDGEGGDSAPLLGDAPLSQQSSMQSLVDSENRATQELYLGRGTPEMLSAPSMGHSSRSSSDASADDDYSQLDRYGFFVPRRSGTSGNTGDDDDAATARGARLARREARRALKWLDMLRVLEASGEPPARWPGAHAAFERRVVKGVPDCLRAKVWRAFAAGDAGPLVVSGDEYRALYGRISGFERQIDLDIERTLRDHVLFRQRFSQAQVSLFKVLVAYSNADPEVGYCQGMSTIAAFLLLYFDEEAAYALLARLMARGSLRQMYTAGFPRLFELFSAQEALMARYLPRLRRRLEAFGIPTSVYATKWYMTLYLSCLPFGTATRVWDLFLLWGPDVLVATAIALLQTHAPRLMRLEYEACMAALGRLPEAPADPDDLLSSVWAVWRTVRRDLGPDAFASLCAGAGRTPCCV